MATVVDDIGERVAEEEIEIKMMGQGAGCGQTKLPPCRDLGAW